MATTTIQVQAAKPSAAPQLAARLGEAFAAAYTLFAHSRRKRRAAAQSAETRRLAHDYDNIDPRIAADLYAAADRHDLLNGNL